jgi:hypothetical protein
MKGERDLQWYLTEGIPKFERSPMGSMIEMLDLRAWASRECPRCKGLGFTDEPWVMHRDWNGNDISPRAIQSGRECHKCKGVGGLPIRQSNGGEYLTARPKSSHDESNREAPDDATLTRYAIVSRRLSRMARVLSEALQVGYGPDGEANALTIRGRAWAVTPQTRAGQELLERFRGKNPDHETAWMPVHAMVEISRQDAAAGNPQRTKLLAEAGNQARHLLAMAELDWEEQIAGECHRGAYARTA